MKKPNSENTSFFTSALTKLLDVFKFEKITDKASPDAQVKRINNMKRLSAIVSALILVLVIIILLLRSCGAVDMPHGSVDIPGNVIDGPSVVPKADLELLNRAEGENKSFYVKDMDGGDTESIQYRVVAIYNSDFTLKYDMTVRENEEFKKLAEVLRVKVELAGKDGSSTLYDGLLADMPTLELALTCDKATSSELAFLVSVYLDAPLAEQYKGQRLVADMSWWIEGQDNVSVANNDFSTVAKALPPAPPEVIPQLKFASSVASDNVAFDMKDIKDGDSQTRYFAFEVTHGKDIKLVMDSSIVTDSKLKDVLHVKVELVGDGNVTLYEGLLRDLDAEYLLKKNDENKTTVRYKVTVTAVGLTEYYYSNKLVCDFSWSLVGTSEQLKVPSNSFVSYEEPLTPPTPPTPPNPPKPPDPPKPPETATSIELSAKDGYDNVPFDVSNMLPGDSKSQYYCVSVTHDKPATVDFFIDVDESQILSRVMKVKIEQLVPDDTDKVLYDGPMKNCTSVKVSVTASAKTVTPIYYRITVYTNGAEVGNEYIGQSLTADFSWQLQ